MNWTHLSSDSVLVLDDAMPPMESLFSLPTTRQQRDRFLEEVRLGDIFCCTVTAVQDMGIQVQVLCYATNRNREIDQLKIPVSAQHKLATLSDYLLLSYYSTYLLTLRKRVVSLWCSKMIGTGLCLCRQVEHDRATSIIIGYCVYGYGGQMLL